MNKTAALSGKPLCPGNTGNDPDGNRHHGHANRFRQDDPRQKQTKERLQQLQLPDPGNAAKRQSPIPEEKTDQHAEQRNITKTKPCRTANSGKAIWQGRNAECRHRQKRYHQRPADHLPSTKTARQFCTLGIAKPANDNRAKHKKITA